MGTLLSLALVAVFAAIMIALALLGGRVRRRGVGMAVLNQVDEIFRPATHHYRSEIAMYEERMLPMPSADDKRPSAVDTSTPG